jgi:hypothetical protein
MYFLLILFFGSLLGIIFMIGRKLSLLHNGQAAFYKNENVSEDPILEAWKHETMEGVKKYSYAGLVAIVRIYVHSSNYLKIRYQELKLRIKNRFGKKAEDEEVEKEASKFLKMISDYKHKIRKIRRQIKEEEEI